MNVNIQSAGQKDLAAVIELLSANHLPVSDLVQEDVQILIAYANEELVATIGLEKHGSTGLLRSLAVKETFRNKKLAERMLEVFYSLCQLENITDVYLLTSTAVNYFKDKGFQKVAREMVPAVIKRTREFRSICPASAVVMHRRV